MPVAGALKGPLLIIVHRILRRQSWPLSVLDFSSVLLGDYLFILVEDFYIEPASLKTSPPLVEDLYKRPARCASVFGPEA